MVGTEGRGALDCGQFSSRDRRFPPCRAAPRPGLILRCPALAAVPAGRVRAPARRPGAVLPPPMTSLTRHPHASLLRQQLRRNFLLSDLGERDWAALEPMLSIVECRKGEPLECQGAVTMEQYFILDGILKRVVSNPEGKEMILRFAGEQEFDTSYAAWRLGTPIPFSIRAVTPVRAAKLSMEEWVGFLDRHPSLKARFEFEVMKLMSEVMAHTITLHLLDAPGRVARFMRKHRELVDRLPKKELTSYLNLSPETLSRLKQRGKIPA